MRYNRLPSGYVYGPMEVLHAKRASKHDSEFVEFRRLPRLNPAGGSMHVSDTRQAGLRIHPSDVFLNEFGPVSGRFNANRLGNECRHPAVCHPFQKHLRQSSQAVYTDNSLGILL